MSLASLLTSLLRYLCFVGTTATWSTSTFTAGNFRVQSTAAAWADGEMWIFGGRGEDGYKAWDQISEKEGAFPILKPRKKEENHKKTRGRMRKKTGGAYMDSMNVHTG